MKWWTFQSMPLLLFLLRVTEGEIVQPPYFNVAKGKEIIASATCGVDSDGPEQYCQLVDTNSDQVCDFCDQSIPEKIHPPEYAVDGLETWWQSPPLSRGMKYNEVNLTINFGQEFYVAYVLMKMGNSHRPGVWFLENSKDYGKTWQPWQYFADSEINCLTYFGVDALAPITKDDSVICTTEYSKMFPPEDGEIPIPILNNRPSTSHYLNSTILQEWTRATNVRFRFLKIKNLLGHSMSLAREDPTVTRKYFYSIKDITIAGQCSVNGHATCNITDTNEPKKLESICQHNTYGPQCETCLPGFHQKKWRQSTAFQNFTCEPCNCFGHSTDCEYDAETNEKHLSLDIHGNYEGGGICKNCQHNTQGINCNKCKEKFYRPSEKHLNATDVCQQCNCDHFYSTGNCAESTGKCECRKEYMPPDCDSCANGFYGYPDCRPCDCHPDGVDSNQSIIGSPYNVCDVFSGNCTCKNNFKGRTCDLCEHGYYSYPNCSNCNCEIRGTESGICNEENGACLCKEGYGGDRCDQCINSYYDYPNCTSCNCSTVGSSSISCDATGKCSCFGNFTGRTCDQCSPGYYKYPDCVACDSESHGSNGVFCDDGKSNQDVSNQKMRIENTTEMSLNGKDNPEQTLENMNGLESDVKKKIGLLSNIISEVQALALENGSDDGAKFDNALKEAKDILSQIQETAFVTSKDEVTVQSNTANATSISLVSFEDGAPGYVRWQNVSADNVLRITLKFRTLASNGVIFYATNPDQTISSVLTLEDGILVFKSHGEEIRSGSVGNKFNNNEWHLVTASHDHQALHLDIDDAENYVATSIPPALNFQSGDVYIGHFPNAQTGPRSTEPFVGCIKHVTFNGEIINFANAKEHLNAQLGKCLERKGPVSANTESEPTNLPLLAVTDVEAITMENTEPKSNKSDIDTATPPPEGDRSVTIAPTTEETTVASEITTISPEPEHCKLPYMPENDPDTENAWRFGAFRHSRIEYRSFSDRYRDKYDSKISIKTMVDEGLIFYASAVTNHSFIAVHVRSGRLHYTFDCGSGPALMQSNIKINDNQWHTIIFKRNDTLGELIVDDYPAVSGYLQGDARTLSVNSPFYVGGVIPELSTSVNEQIGINKTFSGCIGNFTINGQAVGEPVEKFGVIQCSMHVEPGLFFYPGNGSNLFKAMDKFTVGRSIDIQMDIKPRTMSGHLLSVHGKRDFLLLEMVNGTIRFLVKTVRGNIETSFVPTAPHSICNGYWHSIRAVKHKNAVLLSVDHATAPPAISPKNSYGILSKHPIFIGGHPFLGKRLRGSTSHAQYVGCMRNLMINRQDIHLDPERAYGRVTTGVCPTI